MKLADDRATPRIDFSRVASSKHGLVKLDVSKLAKRTSDDDSSDSAAAATEEGEEGNRAQGALLMLAVALLWGSNFPAVKATIEAGLPGSAAAASRFSIAALALSPLLRGAAIPSELVVGGLECGCWLALGYIAQALALHDLPAGTVAFLASLQVVFVPLMQTFSGGAFTPRLALAAALCMGGVGLLELGPELFSGGADASSAAAAAAGLDQTFVFATLLALLQPVGFGTSYLRIESLMRKFPTHGLQLSALQLISNAGIALLWCALDASGLLSALDGRSGLEAISTFDLSALQEPAVLAGVAYTGLISTALTVLLQTRALGMLPAADSSVIVATEPLWAAGFAAILLGEHLDSGAQVGGAFILLGCLSNTLFPTDLGLGGAGGGKEEGAAAMAERDGTMAQ